MRRLDIDVHKVLGAEICMYLQRRVRVVIGKLKYDIPVYEDFIRDELMGNTQCEHCVLVNNIK